MMICPRFHQRIAQKAADPAEPALLIVALGDSVTQGATTEGCYDFEALYHNRLKHLLEERHPQATFSVINAGCNGEGLPGGLRRLGRDVIRHQPDLVLIAYGLNDATAGGERNLTRFRANLYNVIARIRAATEAEIVLLTPNWMATHDNERVPQRWKDAINSFVRIQSSGTLAQYAATIRAAAADAGTALADVYAAWSSLAAEGTDITTLLANGINHPDATMHSVTAELIMEAIHQ